MALLDQLRADEEPSAERLDAVLDRVLAAGPAPAAPAVTKLTLLKGGLAVLAVGAVAIPFVAGNAPEAPAPEPAPVVAQAPRVEEAVDRPEAVPDEAPPIEEEPAAEEAAPPTEVTVPATKAGPPKKTGVAEEVALMGRIRRAIQAGDSDRALRLLRQHGRRFPNGVFADEREVSLAEALCAAGKLDKGQDVANGFVARNPQSPLAARARRACADRKSKPGAGGAP